MTQQLQCPICSSVQISPEARRLNEKTGYTFGAWYLGCLGQLAIVIALFAIIGFSVRALWPANPFAEAFVLIGFLSAFFLICLVVLLLVLSRWPTVEGYACDACGHKWYPDAPPERQKMPA